MKVKKKLAIFSDKLILALIQQTSYPQRRRKIDG
jgi:hypothetical protein